MALVATREERAAYAKAEGLAVWQVCAYCGLADAKVEAGGVWFCPCEWCPGPAGGQIRHAVSCKDCKTIQEDRGITVIQPCANYPEAPVMPKADEKKQRDVTSWKNEFIELLREYAKAKFASTPETERGTFFTDKWMMRAIQEGVWTPPDPPK